MIVLILERVTPGLRGMLTRWFMEPKSGIFVGDVSAMVRDKVWDETCKRIRQGGGMLIYSTNNEQGYAIRNYGRTDRLVRDFEGLTLMTYPLDVDEHTHKRKRTKKADGTS